jgi:hypothetical protein
MRAEIRGRRVAQGESVLAVANRSCQLCNFELFFEQLNRWQGKKLNDFALCLVAPTTENRTVAPKRAQRTAEPGEFANFLAVSYAGCSPSAGGAATGSAGASTGSAETTGSCSGATSTAGLGVGSGVGSALGVI